MNPHSSDLPELTAYALGELEASEARELHALLQENPEVADELAEIETLTDALRHGAPISFQRLTPEQRQAVLRPAALPRRVIPMQPRLPVRRPAPGFAKFVAGITKAAAVIALAGLAFLTGRHFSGGTAGSLASITTPANASEQPAPEAAVQATTPASSLETKTAPSLESPDTLIANVTTPALPPVPVFVEATEPAKVTAPEATKTEVKPSPTVAEVTKTAPATTPTPTPAAATPAVAKTSIAALSVSHTIPGANTAFVNASKHPTDAFNLQPALIRPAPVKPAGAQFAAPLPPAQAAPANNTKAPRTPDLYIHSWKADVASCPWNEAHRLLRVVIQIPADQPGTLNSTNYPVQISFDPNYVRDYRLLCERHQPAKELRTAGTHVLWYELQPNGAAIESARESGRTLATVTLPAGRFTTQSVGPFDSTKLNVLDRGTTWQQAREDFIFESSVVGFGMLLRGAERTGSLDHNLVLTLATKAQGNDATGERARFIELVSEAKQAAGL